MAYNIINDITSNSCMGRINNNPQPKVKIDKADRMIMTLLAEDSRMPLTSIAKRVGLSRDAVNYRIKKLQDANIILRFVPIIDTTRFGFYTHNLFISTNEILEEKKKQMLQTIMAHPNVKSVMEYSDRWDLEITISAFSTPDFLKTCIQLFDANKSVIETAKLRVITYYKSLSLPKSFYENVNVKHPTQKADSTYVANDKDLAILRELSNDCRLSTYEIGSRLGMSPDTVGYRMKRLYYENIIKQYTILPNLSALGYQGTVFVMNLRGFDNMKMKQCEEWVAKHPYILRGVSVLGPWDIYLSLATRSPFEFHKTVKEIKNKYRENIQEHEMYRTFAEHCYRPFPEAIIDHHLKKIGKSK
ncbi:AsnC family transcriptional regulator [Candidatus Woesearchaeota archaeon]|nr:AsnC family transcriptional regulator [Candidatus Woesearchaeota archaeon]